MDYPGPKDDLVQEDLQLWKEVLHDEEVKSTRRVELLPVKVKSAAQWLFTLYNAQRQRFYEGREQQFHMHFVDHHTYHTAITEALVCLNTARPRIGHILTRNRSSEEQERLYNYIDNYGRALLICLEHDVSLSMFDVHTKELWWALKYEVLRMIYILQYCRGVNADDISYNDSAHYMEHILAFFTEHADSAGAHIAALQNRQHQNRALMQALHALNSNDSLSYSFSSSSSSHNNSNSGGGGT